MQLGPGRRCEAAASACASAAHAPQASGAAVRTTRDNVNAKLRIYVIAVGTNGAIDDPEDRRYFAEGLSAVAKRLAPKAIVVYGSAPDDIFDRYREAGIEIVQFDCETTTTHKAVE